MKKFLALIRPGRGVGEKTEVRQTEGVAEERKLHKCLQDI